MAFLAHGTGKRHDDALAKRLDTGLGGVPAVHHIVDDNGEPVIGQVAGETDTQDTGAERSARAPLHVILTLAGIPCEHIGDRHAGTPGNGVGQQKHVGGMAGMAWCRDEHGIVGYQGSHQ